MYPQAWVMMSCRSTLVENYPCDAFTVPGTQCEGKCPCRMYCGKCHAVLCSKPTRDVLLEVQFQEGHCDSYYIRTVWPKEYLEFLRAAVTDLFLASYPQVRTGRDLRTAFPHAISSNSLHLCPERVGCVSLPLEMFDHLPCMGWPRGLPPLQEPVAQERLQSKTAETWAR